MPILAARPVPLWPHWSILVRWHNSSACERLSASRNCAVFSGLTWLISRKLRREIGFAFFRPLWKLAKRCARTCPMPCSRIFTGSETGRPERRSMPSANATFGTERSQSRPSCCFQNIPSPCAIKLRSCLHPHTFMADCSSHKCLRTWAISTPAAARSHPSSATATRCGRRPRLCAAVSPARYRDVV